MINKEDIYKLLEEFEIDNKVKEIKLYNKRNRLIYAVVYGYGYYYLLSDTDKKNSVEANSSIDAKRWFVDKDLKGFRGEIKYE